MQSLQLEDLHLAHRIWCIQIFLRPGEKNAMLKSDKKYKRGIPTTSTDMRLPVRTQVLLFYFDHIWVMYLSLHLVVNFSCN
jgi:hypothetical protein